jgi:hypothetical protein
VQHERSQRATLHTGEQGRFLGRSREPVEVIGNHRKQMWRNADAAATGFGLRRSDYHLAVLKPLSRSLDPELARSEVDVTSLQSQQLASAQPAPRRQENNQLKPLAYRIREQLHFDDARDRPLGSTFDAGALDRAWRSHNELVSHRDSQDRAQKAIGLRRSRGSRSVRASEAPVPVPHGERLDSRDRTVAEFGKDPTPQ